jgi:hypothetical protein
MKTDETTGQPITGDAEQTVRSVRERYGIARTGSVLPPQAGCCGGGSEQLIALGIGYTPSPQLLLTAPTSASAARADRQLGLELARPSSTSAPARVDAIPWPHAVGRRGMPAST